MKKDIRNYRNRFYNLLESEIGNVKPLISEEMGDTFDETINLQKDGETDEQWQAALVGAAEAAAPYVVPAVTNWALDKLTNEEGDIEEGEMYEEGDIEEGEMYEDGDGMDSTQME